MIAQPEDVALLEVMENGVKRVTRVKVLVVKYFEDEPQEVFCRLVDLVDLTPAVIEAARRDDL